MRSPRAASAAARTRGSGSSQAFLKTAAASLAPTPGQGLQRASADRPEGIGPKARGEGGPRSRIVFEGQERRGRVHPADHVVVPELEEELLVLLGESDLHDEDIVRVEAHQQGLLLEGQLERLFLLFDPDLADVRFLRRDELDGHGHSENGHAPREVLDLGDLEPDDLRDRVPFAPDLEDGMTRFEQPLIEEPVEVLAGDGLDRPDEVGRVDRVEGVAVEEMAERLEERLVADEGAQHMQDAGALGVGVGVEHVLGRIVAVGNDRTDVARPGLAQVGVELVPKIERPLVVAFLEAAIEIVRIGREALVEPSVGPAAEGDQVAPPLVGQLVRDDADGREIGLILLVDHDPMGHGRGRGALDAAAGGDRDLVVLLPGIVVAEDAVEELDHLRRLPVGRPDLGSSEG